MVSARDHESRMKWQKKYFAQPTQPHLIDYIRFQIFDVLSLLLFEEYATVQHYRYVLIKNTRDLMIDELKLFFDGLQWAQFIF